MSHQNQNFFEGKMTSYNDAVEEIIDENAEIKSRINLLIQELTVQRDGQNKNMKLAIKEAEKLRLEEEVAELLADEQRSTTMGGWA